MPKARPLTTSSPAARQLAAELARDLAAVGAGAPGADDRHRGVGSSRSSSAGIAAADQRPGRRRRRRASAAADSAASWRQQAQQPQPRSASRPALGDAPPRPAPSSCPRCFGADRLRPGPRSESAQQLRRARARARRSRPSRCSGASSPSEQRAAQAVGAGDRRAHLVAPPQLQRLRPSARARSARCRRGRRSSARAAAPGRGRGR